MPRSDGTPVKDISAFDKLIPHIMSRRYDATNFIKVEIDMTPLQSYLRELREKGCKVGTMDAVIAAFAFMLKKRPEVNRFIANKKIYQRNHVCVSFVMLKRSENEPIETAVKIYIDPEDDLMTISQKIRDTIKENEQPQVKNAMDMFVDNIMSLPLLPRVLIGTIKCLDKFGFLPKNIIKLSPFHTSMFISNLASIKTNYAYHHLYEFGTTSLFVTLGKPTREKVDDGKIKQTMTLGISMDDRVCTGVVWTKAFYEFKRYIENPSQMI